MKKNKNFFRVWKVWHDICININELDYEIYHSPF